MKINGQLFNGRTSSEGVATLEREDHTLKLCSSQNNAGLDTDGRLELQYNLSNCRISDRLGTLPYAVDFPDGKRFLTHDHAAFENYILKDKNISFMHRLETSWKLAFTCAAALVSLLLLLHFVVFPWSAKEIANVLPRSLVKSLSKETLVALETTWLNKTTLNPAEQKRIASLASHLQSEFPDSFHRLLVYKAPAIGPNALALPDGTIIMTHEALQLINDDQEIKALLYHEIGHVVEKHSMRLLVQDAGISLVLLVFFGDVSWTALPLTLLANTYSRSMEAESDAFAARALIKQGLSPTLLGNVLVKLEASEKSPHKIPSLLSTHPATSERVKALKRFSEPSPQSQRQR